MSTPPHKEMNEGGGVQSPGDHQEHTEREQGSPSMKNSQLYDFDVREQDRWLPIANVARIMKTALPDNAKIAKEAKECMQECVSEFISFITSEASEKCQQEKRKTVNGEDILFAMTSLGFENYAEALKIYLAKYREAQARGDSRGGGGGGGGGAASSSSANVVQTSYHGGRPHSPSHQDLSPENEDGQGGYGDVGVYNVGNGAGGQGY